MLHLLVTFLKNLFGKNKPTAPPEPQKFTITHEWPFRSPQPLNEDYLLREMIRGVQINGDHTFYYFQGHKRRHLRTEKGRETHLARNIVWWMEGRKHPETSNGLQTICGEPKCIKLSHLSLSSPKTVYGPHKPKPKPQINHVAKNKQPPQSKAPKNRKPQEKITLEKGDRSKCITSKVYFSTRNEARKRATFLNSPEIRGKGRRVYPYDTPCPYCFGWHLTKIKPGTYQKPQIKNSAY
jgi:hypothetical protein